MSTRPEFHIYTLFLTTILRSYAIEHGKRILAQEKNKKKAPKAKSGDIGTNSKTRSDEIVLTALRRFPQHPIPQEVCRRSLLSVLKLSRRWSFHRQRSAHHQRSRTQQANPTAFTMVPPDYGIPLRWLWCHLVCRMYPRLYRLETPWRSTSGCQPGAGYCARVCVGGSSCILFLAGFLQFTCHGFHHWHATRQMHRPP